MTSCPLFSTSFAVAMALVLQPGCLQNRLLPPLEEKHSVPGRGFGFQGKAHGSLKETLEMCLAA
jgi:hypothetical protein